MITKNIIPRVKRLTATEELEIFATLKLPKPECDFGNFLNRVLR